MKTFNNAQEIINAGFSIEKSIEGQYRLMYNDRLVFEDTANEDMSDYDMAAEYFNTPAAEYLESIEKYVGCIADMGAGATLIESEEEAMDVKDMVDKFGSVEYGKDHEDFNDVCNRLDLDPIKNKVERVFWIGGNVCACFCLSSDWSIAE